MSEKNKRGKLDTRINKIIVETSAVIVGFFSTIGLVMSQVFEKGTERFYELLGWSISLTVPFILSAILSVVVIAYAQEPQFKWLRYVRHASILGYIFAWFCLIINASSWSPVYFWSVISGYASLLVLSAPIVIVIVVLYILYTKKSRKKPKLSSRLRKKSLNG